MSTGTLKSYDIIPIPKTTACSEKTQKGPKLSTLAYFEAL